MEAHIQERYVTLTDGRVVRLFVNLDTYLIVLDVEDADRMGGVEVYRHAHTRVPPQARARSSV